MPVRQGTLLNRLLLDWRFFLRVVPMLSQPTGVEAELCRL